jgi:hypothetical protein
MMAMGMVFLCALNAPALTIETHFIGGEAPVNVVGKGNLNDIVNAAARIWESVYSDSTTLTLYYGWADTGNAGTHSLSTQGGTPNREVSGTILLDNSGAASFYLDETPYLNEEYRKITEESQDLGGGDINAARVFSNPIGDAAGHLDLLSVVLHEMGHALGMSAANTSFIENTGTGLLHISSDLPFVGTTIPLSYNNAGIVAHFDVDVVAYGSLMAGINADERRLPSELDILANAQLSNLTIIRLRADQTAPSDNTGNNDNRGMVRRPNTRGASESGRFSGERKVRDIRDSLTQIEMR